MLSRRLPVPDLHPRHRNGANAGLDRPFRPVTMPDKSVTAIGKLQILHRRKKGFSLHLESLRKQAPRSGPKDICQGIVDLAGLAQAVNVANLGHGVSLSFGGSGWLDIRLDTPPFSNRHHPGSTIAPFNAIGLDCAGSTTSQHARISCSIHSSNVYPKVTRASKAV